MTTKISKLPTRENPKLQKFLADSGICSRRRGEQLIENGEVTVNGKLAKLGCRISPKSDSIKVQGKLIFPKSIDRLCLLINKPKGFTCSNSDTFAKRLIFDLLEEEHKKQRLFCAGRLDVESEGLVILTNDGDLTYKLTHPSQRIEKKYEVELNKPLIENDRFKLISGIEDKEDFLRLDKIEKRGKHGDSKRLIISMGHGKKREIRRAFSRVGYRVIKLRRVALGALKIGKTPKGGYRVLKNKEIDLLFS